MPKRATPKPDLTLPLEIQRSRAERILAFVVMGCIFAIMAYLAAVPWLPGAAEARNGGARLVEETLFGTLALAVIIQIAWIAQHTDWLRIKYVLTEHGLQRESSRGILESAQWNDLVWITSDFRHACFSNGVCIPIDGFWPALPSPLKGPSKLANAALRHRGPILQIAKLGHRLNEARDHCRQIVRMSLMECVLISIFLAVSGAGYVVTMIAIAETKNPSFVVLQRMSATLFVVGITGLFLTAGLWALRIKLHARLELRWWKRGYGQR